MEQGKQITRKAYGKINLGLDVLRKLPSGYHEVKMIMQTVDLYDELTFQIEEPETFEMTTNLPEIPVDGNNLIMKAAKLFFEKTGIHSGISIHLEKHIPVAAGMAGGSTDAAATLLGLSELFETNLSMKELEALGVSLGADVPYCLHGKTMLCEGIGEIMTPLPDMKDLNLVIAKPPISVSTKMVYESLKVDQLSAEDHVDIDGMIQGIRENNSDAVIKRLKNVLETVTIAIYPQIEEVKKTMLQNKAINALMSGSGPTVFGVFDTREDAKKAASELERLGLANQIFVTGLWNN